MNHTYRLIAPLAFSLTSLLSNAQAASFEPDPHAYIQTQQGDWMQTLHARDANQDGLIDFIYDQRQDVSWYVGYYALSNSYTIPQVMAESPVYLENPLSFFDGYNFKSATFNGKDAMVDTLFFTTLGNNYVDSKLNFGFFSPLLQTVMRPNLPFEERAFTISSPYAVSGESALTFNFMTGRIYQNQYDYENDIPTDRMLSLLYQSGDPHAAFAVSNPYGVVSAPVPEPSSWALVMSGMFTASFVAYRRRPIKIQHTTQTN